MWSGGGGRTESEATGEANNDDAWEGGRGIVGRIWKDLDMVQGKTRGETGCVRRSRPDSGGLTAVVVTW